MIIYIIRHPETEFNRKEIMQGHLDSPLTKKGETTAKRAIGKLKDKHISKIFSSDLGRCMQTSKIINDQLNVDIIPKKELREQDYGDLNGKKYEYIIKKFGLNNPNLIMPNGESFNQMKNRIINFIKKLKENKPILIVTHHGCLKAIYETFDLNSKKYEIKPDQIYVLDTKTKNISKIS